MLLHNVEKDRKFESVRLRFRGIAKTDEDNLVKWRSREDIYSVSSNPRPISSAEHRVWFEKYLNDPSSYRAIITDKETATDIGVVGGVIKDMMFELSCYIGEPEYRGRGFASEAVRAITEFLFLQKIVNAVRAVVNVGNESSCRMLISAGFKESQLVFINCNK